jgi:hypothetical protein
MIVTYRHYCAAHHAEGLVNPKVRAQKTRN